MGNAIKKTEEIRQILQAACARRELMILATPFLRFESAFLALGEDEIQAQATMSREDAIYGLRTSDLKIRFPHGPDFFEAPVKMLGLGLLEGRRTLRLSIPKAIQDNDQRGAFRVERVGRVAVTFSTPRSEIHTAALVDISTTGVRLLAQRDLSKGLLEVGDRFLVSIPLAQDIQINADVVLRHLDTRRMGLEFRPTLPKATLDPLSRWVFLRREEEQELLARRLELKLAGPLSPEQSIPSGAILLVSEDEELEEALRPALQKLRAFHRVAPVVQVVKDALGCNPALVIFHVRSLGLDQRKRAKTLVEMGQAKAPVLLLGTEVDSGALFELSAEWKAASALAWSPQRATFLERLAQGIIRRYFTGGESPMAPKEL